jgi:uncharacterized protein
MSQKNIEVVRNAFEAYNRGDFDAALELMHPDIEWHTPDVFPDAGTYRGRERVREFWESWPEMFRGFQLHLEDCSAVGEEHVVATFRVSGEGAESGVGVESPAVFQLGELRDGLIIWVGMFLTSDEALEAARGRG